MTEPERAEGVLFVVPDMQTAEILRRLGLRALTCGSNAEADELLAGQLAPSALNGTRTIAVATPAEIYLDEDDGAVDMAVVARAHRMADCLRADVHATVKVLPAPSRDCPLADVLAGVRDAEVWTGRLPHAETPRNAATGETLEERAARLDLDPDTVRADAEKYRLSTHELLDLLEPSLADRQQRSPAEHLAEANQALGLRGDRRIRDFIEETGDDRHYIFEGERGRARISPRALTEWRPSRAAILAATGSLPLIAPRRWLEILSAHLLPAATVVDLGAEATDRGEGASLLIEYLQDRPVLDDRDTAAVTQTPYREEGRLYIFGPAFHRWLNFQAGVKASRVRLGQLLAAAGATCEVAHVNVDGRRTTRSVWRLPPDLDAEPGGRW